MKEGTFMTRRNRIIPYRRNLKQIARKLRKNSTPGEIALWLQLKGKRLGVGFHRQVPIDKFIVDFYCHDLMVAIEIDGRIHDHPEQHEKDRLRQQRLESFGIRFLRFREREVFDNLVGIVETIREFVESDAGRRSMD